MMNVYCVAIVCFLSTALLSVQGATAFSECSALPVNLDPDPFATSSCVGYASAARSLCSCLGVNSQVTARAASGVECVANANSALSCIASTMCLRQFVRSIVGLAAARVNTSDSCFSFGEAMHVAQMAPSSTLGDSCSSLLCFIASNSALSSRCGYSTTSTFCVPQDITADPIANDPSRLLAIGNLTFFSIAPTTSPASSSPSSPSTFTVDDLYGGVETAITSDLSSFLTVPSPPLTTLNIFLRAVYLDVSFAVVKSPLAVANVSVLNAIAQTWMPATSQRWASSSLAAFLRAHASYSPQVILVNITLPTVNPTDPTTICNATSFLPYAFSTCNVASLQASLCSCLGSSQSTLPGCLVNLGTSVTAVCVNAQLCFQQYMAALNTLSAYQFSNASGCSTFATTMHRNQLASVLSTGPFVGSPLQTACTSQLCNLTSYNSQLRACDYTGVCSAALAQDPAISSSQVAITVGINVSSVRANASAITAKMFLSLINALETDLTSGLLLTTAQVASLRVISITPPLFANATGTLACTYSFGYQVPNAQALLLSIQSTTSIVLRNLTSIINTLPVGSTQVANSLSLSSAWPMRVASTSIVLTTTRAPPTTTSAPRTTQAPPITPSPPFTPTPTRVTLPPSSTVSPPSSASTSIFDCFRNYDIDYGASIGRNIVSNIMMGGVALWLLGLMCLACVIRCCGTEGTREDQLRLCVEIGRVIAISGYGLVTIWSIFYGSTGELTICFPAPTQDDFCNNFTFRFGTVSIVTAALTFLTAPIALMVTFYVRVWPFVDRGLVHRKVLRYGLVLAGDVLPLLLTPGYLAIEGRGFGWDSCVTSPLVAYADTISGVHLVLLGLLLLVALVDSLILWVVKRHGYFAILSTVLVWVAIFWGLSIAVVRMSTIQAPGWPLYTTIVLLPVILSVLHELLFLLVFRRALWFRHVAPSDDEPSSSPAPAAIPPVADAQVIQATAWDASPPPYSYDGSAYPSPQQTYGNAYGTYGSPQYSYGPYGSPPQAGVGMYSTGYDPGAPAYAGYNDQGNYYNAHPQWSSPLPAQQFQSPPPAQSTAAPLYGQGYYRPAVAADATPTPVTPPSVLRAAAAVEVDDDVIPIEDSPGVVVPAPVAAAPAAPTSETSFALQRNQNRARTGRDDKDDDDIEMTNFDVPECQTKDVPTAHSPREDD